MEPELIGQYIKALKEIKAGGYCIPQAPDNEAFDVTHGTFSMWAPELVVIGRGRKNLAVLLAPYEGTGKMSKLNGQYHLPGGYNRMNDANIEAICKRIAERELGASIEITDPHYPLWIQWWIAGEHPLGRPLSIFFEAHLKSAVTKGSWKFYRATDLPQPMVKPHEEFVQRILVPQTWIRRA